MWLGSQCHASSAHQLSEEQRLFVSLDLVHEHVTRSCVPQSCVPQSTNASFYLMRRSRLFNQAALEWFEQVQGPYSGIVVMF